MGITTVEIVVAGPQGLPGIPGASTHAGGLQKQVLMKLSGTDYDVVWDYTDALDVTFTSSTGIAATSVEAAIDEVNSEAEAGIAGNSDRLLIVETRGELDLSLTTEDIGVVLTPGIYTTTGTNNLPNSITAATLTVEQEVVGGTDVVRQLLTATSDGKEYVRDKVGVAAFSEWTEDALSAEVTALYAKIPILNSTSIDIDTLIDTGIHYVDTNLPFSIVSGRVTINTFSVATTIEQILEDNANGKSYSRTSLLGDGSDWTAWSILAHFANTTDTLKYEDLTGNEPAYAEGQVYYADGTLNIQGKFSDTATQVGEELLVPITNATGSTFVNGRVVRFNSVVGGMPAPVLAQADTLSNAANVAVITHDILSGADGKATTYGVVRGIDTSAFTVTDRLYVSDVTPGALTNVAPDIATLVGFVLVSDPVVGSIFVNPIPNIALPNIFGVLSDGTAGVTFTAGIYQLLGTYGSSSEVAMATNTSLGTISTIGDGSHRVTANIAMRFDAIGNITETMTLGLFDDVVGLVSETEDYIDRTAESFSMYPSIIFTAVAGRTYHVELKASYALQNVTYSQSSFDITSLHLR